MSADDYTSIPSAGKLKLKGVKDSKVSKKKKLRTRDENPKNDLEDNFVMLKTLEDEDREIRKEERGKQRESHKQGIEENSAEDFGVKVKTEAEKRYEEQRRKRLDDRLKREGVKTHKQRVEELNRYLSGLSEHHDMPRIGPG